MIAALGKAEFMTGDWIKPGAAVIDVGINAVDDPSAKKGYKLVGDVNYEQAVAKAGWITPVPGGVGPMTICMLLQVRGCPCTCGRQAASSVWRVAHAAFWPEPGGCPAQPLRACLCAQNTLEGFKAQQGL